jgi:hypothetical protein
MEMRIMQHKCRGCGIFVPERELYSPDDPDDPQAVLLCKGCYMSHFAAEEEEEEEELNKYMVSVPVIHYYSIGPVEAYDEDEAADEVRENWSEWRHTIEDNGDWGGPTWRYSKCRSMEPEAYEVFESEESFRAEPSKLNVTQVETVNSREGFFDDEQDKEYFGFGFIAGGIIVGVLGTIFGNIFSELVLDEMRVNKFGYRGTGDKSSFWELDGE